MTSLLIALLLHASADSDLAAEVKKTYGLRPEAVRCTQALEKRFAETSAQKSAEALLLDGGVNAVGALSLALNAGDEATMLAVLVESESGVKDERTAAATRLLLTVLRNLNGRRVSRQTERALGSQFPRDRLVALFASDGPTLQPTLEALRSRPLPPQYRRAVEWLAAHRKPTFDVGGLFETVDGGSN